MIIEILYVNQTLKSEAYASAVSRMGGHSKQGLHLLEPTAVPMGTGRLRAGEDEITRGDLDRVKRYAIRCSETAWLLRSTKHSCAIMFLSFSSISSLPSLFCARVRWAHALVVCMEGRWNCRVGGVSQGLASQEPKSVRMMAKSSTRPL